MGAEVTAPSLLHPGVHMRAFLALLLALAIAFPSFAAPKVPLDSIRQLSDIHDDGEIHEICTTWATKVESLTKWVTAGHCVVLNEDKTIKMGAKYLIGGKPATLVALDISNDLALFNGPAANGLTVALGEPSLGQDVYTYGFFWSTGVFTKGYVSFPDRKTGRAVFNVAGGPGISGGPVLTMDNLVVGVIQTGACPYACPVMGGATVGMIRAFLKLSL